MLFELYRIFFNSIIIFGGFYATYHFIENYVWLPMIEEGEKSLITDYEEEEEDELSIYLDKYNDTYNSMAVNTKCDIKALVNKQLTEDIPDGVVKMQYCSESESFLYWCKTQVPYTILETVSKKYVIEYDCKGIHVDMAAALKLAEEEDEADKAEEEDKADKAEEEDEADKAEEEDKKDEEIDVFATFKKYNTQAKAGAQA